MGGEECGSSDSGQQYQARLALENAYNYSLGNAPLNEDARVQLHSLNQQQAMVCLIGRRGAIRRNNGLAAGRVEADGLGDNFNPRDVQRVASSLQKDDFTNLQLITTRLVEGQHQAAAPGPQIGIQIPSRGRVLRFSRGLQVDVDQALAVDFLAEEDDEEPVAGNWFSSLGVLLVACLGLLMVQFGSGLVLPGPVTAVVESEETETLDAIQDDQDTDLVDAVAADDDVAVDGAGQDLLADIPGVPTTDDVSVEIPIDTDDLADVESDDEPIASDESDGDADDRPANDEPDEPDEDGEPMA